MLSLSLAGTAPGFGSFVPAVARTYEARRSAVITTPPVTRRCRSPTPAPRLRATSPTAAFSLPQPLKVRATNAAKPSPAYAALAETTGATTPLLTYSGPTTADPVTIGFRQAIGATDVLRAGTYSKTLTFTLTTTTP